MTSSERLRPHPEERLAAPVQAIDLAAAADQLRAEPHAAVAGHRQIALYRQGDVTLILLVFEDGGVLPEHDADGVVTIHVLSGRLQVTAQGEVHDLTPGRLLALGPGVAHDVVARAPSEMLLTVHKVPS